MAGFNFGAFAGGIASGVEQGQQIRERYEKRVEQQRILRAQQDWTDFVSKGAKGGAPSPGAPPVAGPAMGGAPGAGGPAGALGAPQAASVAPAPQANVPQPVPMPGAQPMAAPGGAPAGMPPGGAPPATGMRAPLSAPLPQAGGPPPVPGPAQTPGPQPQAGAPQGGGTPGGPSQPPNPFQGLNPNDPNDMGLGLIRSLATQIAQAYPGRKWKPNELADTLHYGLEQMKDVDPAIRSLAVAQLNAQLKQAGLTQGQEKIDEVKVRDQNIADYRKGVLEQKKADLEGKLKIAAASQAGQDRRTAMRDAVQMQVANIREAGADQRQAAALDAKAQAQAAGLDEKEWETATRAELQREGFDNNYITRLFAADPTKPAGSIKAPVRKPLPGPPQRGGAGTTGTQRNPAKVSTPEEAAKLPPGAFFVTPDGQVRQRHG